jgi:hypothetical protein
LHMSTLCPYLGIHRSSLLFLACFRGGFNLRINGSCKRSISSSSNCHYCNYRKAKPLSSRVVSAETGSIADESTYLCLLQLCHSDVTGDKASRFTLPSSINSVPLSRSRSYISAAILEFGILTNPGTPLHLGCAGAPLYHTSAPSISASLRSKTAARMALRCPTCLIDRRSGLNSSLAVEKQAT